MKTTIKYLLLLISISVNAQLEQETTTYSYDNLNRLVQVVFNDGSTNSYVYDDIGNRTQINIETLSIDVETLKTPIILYPNPTESFLNIKFPMEFNSKDITIELYDINGRLVSDDKSIVQENHVNIDVNALSNGVYLLHLKSDDRKWSKLFIKK